MGKHAIGSKANPHSNKTEKNQAHELGTIFQWSKKFSLLENFDPRQLQRNDIWSQSYDHELQRHRYKHLQLP
jgi:hypothetical protein